MSAPTPDVATDDTVRGWRAWRLLPREAALLALATGGEVAFWPPRQTKTATCSRALICRHSPAHFAPALACRCGIHAMRDSDAAIELALDRSGVVIGEVDLWGIVVEHEHGFRAQHAYPRRLVIAVDQWAPTAGWSEAADRLAAAYGVPVVLGRGRDREGAWRSGICASDGT